MDGPLTDDGRYVIGRKLQGHVLHGDDAAAAVPEDSSQVLGSDERLVRH